MANTATGSFWSTTSGAQSFLEKLGTDAVGELKDLTDDVREEAAYLLGMEAYVYGFPLVMMGLTKEVLTAVSHSGQYGQYKAPINQFAQPTSV